MHGRFERLLWGLSFVALVGLLGALFYRFVFDPTAIIILPDGRAPWIAAPSPATSEIHQWRSKRVPVERFYTFFDAPVRAGPAVLRMRAAGEATLFINGQLVYRSEVLGVMPRSPDDWKAVREIKVGPFMRKGRNSIGVTLFNSRGPGLLSLSLEGRGVSLVTGPGWLTTVDEGPARPAALANDVAPHVTASLGERPLAAAAAHAGSLLLFFALGVVGFWAWRQFADPEAGPRLSILVWVAVTAGWLLLFVTSFVRIEPQIGFDATSHLAYTLRLLNGGSIPLATDGFATYHPPLFYAASGVLVVLGEWMGVARDVALKVLPFVSGFALVGLSWALARRLFPADEALCRLAVLFAALLPMNLYIAAYFTNEGFHAALAAAALFWAVDLLLRDHFSVARLAIFSVLLGLALLTKFSALLVAGVAGAALAMRILLDERAGQGGRVVGLAVLVLPALAIAGWFYVRNVMVFGQPLMGNWHFTDAGQVWWSHPGFHTPAYYLSFGTSLTQPFLASFTSFWDGLYSTLWGDGLLAGLGGIRARHEFWNYSFMAAGYLLAVPATVLGVLGFVRSLGFALNDFDLRRRAVFAMLAVLTLLSFFAMFWLTLSLPYFGQAKAFYALLLTPVLALYIGLGYRVFEEGLARFGGMPARALLYGWLAAFLGCVYLSFSS